MLQNHPYLFKEQMHPELLTLANNAFKASCTGASDQFLYNIDIYLRNAPSALTHYHSIGMQMLGSLLDSGMKVKKGKLEELDAVYHAINAILSKHIVVGIDMQKEGYPSALYTASYDILKELCARDLLTTVKPSEFEDFYLKNIKGFYPKGYEEQSFVSVRLDIEGIINGVPLFKPTKPRSRLQIGVEKPFVAIPLEIMATVEGTLVDLIKDKPFKFVKSTVIGQVSHIATLSPDTVRKVYGKSDPEGVMIESKLRKTTVGFDISQLRFMCYDLESSLHTLGTASFRLEMLDEIKPVRSIREIDISQHNINYDHLRGIFKTRVNKFTVANFKEFTVMPTDGFANSQDKAKALNAWANNMSGKDLYNIMKQYPNLFGDVDKSLETRERMSPRILKELQPIELSGDMMKRRKQLYEMLAKGAVKMVVRSKSKGTISEKLASNNPALLARIHGNDYVKKYESISYRVKDVQNKIYGGEVADKKQLEKAISEYGLLPYVNAEKVENLIKESGGDIRPIALALDKVLEELEEKNKAKEKNPNLIIYRNLNMDDSLYGSVYIENIVSVEYAPFNPSKTK